MSRFALWRIPLALAGTIALASHFPAPPLPETGFIGVDKLAHFCIYGALATGIATALIRSGVSLRRAIIHAALATIAYGMLDELHQAFRPFRSFDLHDWAADICGAAVALSMIAGLPFWRRWMLWTVGGTPETPPTTACPSVTEDPALASAPMVESSSR